MTRTGRMFLVAAVLSLMQQNVYPFFGIGSTTFIIMILDVT